MNLVDSSAWLEYLADGPNADAFTPAIEDREVLVVSTINIYEVFKKVTALRSLDDALRVASLMHQAHVLPVTSEIALSGARISARHRLPMADSLILATARAADAELWTQDADFAGFERVHYLPG